MTHTKNQKTLSYALIAIVIISVSYSAYLLKLNKDNTVTMASMRIESDKLIAEIGEINQKYSEALERVEMNEKEKASLMEAVQRIGMDYNTTLQDYNKKIVEADTLKKTVSIDNELLNKYSKYYFLNENYSPATSSLSSIDTVYTLNGKEILLLTQVKDKLEMMIRDAKSTGIDLYVHSGYRSFKEQQSLKGAYVQKYGLSKSNTFSADQGYSEHQLASTVDISDKVSGLSISLDKTPAFAWLIANAHRYGFIMSYPKGNAYYDYEPWHWRYVGVELATYLHVNNLKFYDLDQKFINTYKVKFFE